MTEHRVKKDRSSSVSSTTSATETSLGSSSSLLLFANEITPKDVFHLAKSSCPAFQKDCPFKENDIQTFVSSMPPPHFSLPSLNVKKSNSTKDMLATTIQNLSSTSTTENCPFGGFTDTMEDLRFSSILVILLEITNMLLTPPPTSPSPPVVMTQLSSSSLSNELKVGTQVSHKIAESVHFIKEFIKGNIYSELYKMLLLNLSSP